MKNPVAYDPSIETFEPDEEDATAELNDSFTQILNITSHDYGRAVRAVHAKAHGLLTGEMTVADGLPPELAQGLFAQPNTYPVALRISTNAGDILPDTIALPRGLAIKVSGVTGERLPGAASDAQDFIMVNGPVFQAKTPKQFASSLKLLAKTTDRMEGAKETLSTVLSGVNHALKAVGLSSATLQSMGGAPNVDPLGETYYSVTPFRYGRYIAKFSLAPVSPDLTRHTGRTIDTSDNPDAIREVVSREMRATKAVWAFRAQLCRNLRDQPIEDPTVRWDEEEAPFFTVATITVNPQESWAPEKVRTIDEGMRFSVWNGLDAHRPLGGINRARLSAYDHSATFRQNFNGCPLRL